MQRINSVADARRLAPREKKLILISNPNFKKVYDVLESKWRECSQNTAGADAFPGSEEDGRALTQALEMMKTEKRIDIETLGKIKAISMKFGWDFPELREELDESKVYGRDHLWYKNNAKRAVELWEISRLSQTQAEGGMNPGDEAEITAIAGSIKDGKISDSQIQMLARLCKKYIKK